MLFRSPHGGGHEGGGAPFQGLLENFGIEIDESKNSKIRGGQDCIISKENSKVKIMVILTDEELMIARDTLRLIK